jgi:ketol-acid reductoisomerase
MDWMYANCSTTAQRGALDWWKKFRDATAPVFKELYESVAAGKESQRSIDSNSQPDYREKLEEELKELRESEMWQAGKTVRSLRPENQKVASPPANSSSTKDTFRQQALKTESIG